MQITYDVVEERLCFAPAARIRGERKRCGAVEDLEFSESGRDPRFLPGWFILPTLTMGTVTAAIVYLLV
jgi:hypothetical protein